MILLKKWYKNRKLSWRFSFSPHKVIKNLDEVNDEFDYILIATKSLPTIDICGLITNILQPKTKIILIQNGIHIEKILPNLFQIMN